MYGTTLIKGRQCAYSLASLVFSFPFCPRFNPIKKIVNHTQNRIIIGTRQLVHMQQQNSDENSLFMYLPKSYFLPIAIMQAHIRVNNTIPRRDVIPWNPKRLLNHLWIPFTLANSLPHLNSVYIFTYLLKKGQFMIFSVLLLII